MKYTLILILTPFLITGCAGFGGIASTGTGHDSHYLNANRGSSTALMSKAEADNYHRQVTATGEEIDLDKKKRDDTMDSFNDLFGIAKTGMSLLRR